MQMKRLPLIVLPLLLLIIGCAHKPANVSQPTWNLVSTQDSYSNTLSALTLLRSAGTLSADDARKVEQARIVVANVLDVYHSHPADLPSQQEVLATLVKTIAELGMTRDVERNKPRARPRAAEDDAAVLAASDAFRRDAEAGWAVAIGGA